MNSPVLIDAEKCVGCGRCVEICPVSLFALEDGRAVVSGTKCIACGHCEAVCANEAVVVPILGEDTVDYGTLQIGREWMPYGAFDAATLVSLMRSRRSCRHFLDKPIDRAILEDLTQIAVAAPSGTNCQKWTFSILAERPAVLGLVAEMERFFRRLNKLARMPLLRLLSKLGDGGLDTYYRNHYQGVEEALDAWQESRKDTLFFDAPAVILVGSKPGGTTPQEDALLATQNILLAAHAMGLGSCPIGFAVAALKRDRAMRKRVGLAKEETVHAVIAIGHTDRTFCRITRRRKGETRILEP